MVSEQIPLPATSASFEKIAVECTEKLFNGSIDQKSEIAEGWRLLSMDSSKNLQKGFKFAIIMLTVRSLFSVIFTFSIHIVFIIKCASIIAALVWRRYHSVIFLLCCCRPFRISRNKYKPIWPQQQQHHHIIVLFVMIVVCRNFWQLVNIILHTMPPERRKEKR